MGGIFMAINWALEWNWKEKWQLLMKKKSIAVIGCFYFALALTLFFTDNYKQGFDDLIVQLPLLYGPFVIGTSKPLAQKQYFQICKAFVLSVVVATIISVIFYCSHEIGDIRKISLYISHIRFSLLILLALCFSIFYTYTQIDALSTSATTYRWVEIFCYTIFAIWFIIYLFIAQTLTGIGIAIFLAFFTLIWFFIKVKKSAVRIVFSLFLIMLISFCGYTGYLCYTFLHVEKTAVATLTQFSKSGSLYQHDFNSIIENGQYAGLYVAPDELAQTWQEQSQLPYNDTLKNVLIRYLNSKSLTKDREGVLALSPIDLQNIENGIPNYYYTERFGIKKALYPILFSISSHQINNSTLLQRVELWKMSIFAIQKHFWTGGGIGDHKLAIDQEIIAHQSTLMEKKNMGAHNQFLSYFLIGGVFLFLYFVFILIYPVIFLKKYKNLSYLLFFFIIFWSLFTEDTLGTQTGVTLYAFFNGFLLYGKEETPISTIES
jgi:hypothetical protein